MGFARTALSWAVCAIAASASMAIPVQATAAVPLGIGDQRAASFADPAFRSLGVRHTRLVMPWNSIFTEPSHLDTWLGAARSAGLTPMVAFSYTRSDRCDAPCVAPSVRAYARAFSAFRRRYPWVTTLTAWNEANHASQPTARDPRRAAEYYNAARRICRSCRIVAADVLDSSNMTEWLRTFRTHARGRPRLWGLHNYIDANRRRTRGTDRLLRLVPGEVWLTETGGLVEARNSELVYDEARATRALRFLFRLARRRSGRIRRIYLYQWRKTNVDDDFDAGLIRLDGSRRPGFFVVRNELARRRAR